MEASTQRSSAPLRSHPHSNVLQAHSSRPCTSETALHCSNYRDSPLQRRDQRLRPSQTHTSLRMRSIPARCRIRILCPATLHYRSHVQYTVEHPCSGRAPLHLRSSHAHSQCRPRHRCGPGSPQSQTIPTRCSCSTKCTERRTHHLPQRLHSNGPCDPTRPRSSAEDCPSSLLVLHILRLPYAGHVHIHPRWTSTRALHHSRILFLPLRLVSTRPTCTTVGRSGRALS